MQLSLQSASTGTTTTTSANYGTVSATSPSDIITASIVNGVTNPASAVTFAAYLGASGVASPNPVPSGTTTLALSLYPITTLSVASNPWNIVSLSPAYVQIFGGAGTYSVTAPSCSGITAVTVYYNYYVFATPTHVGTCSATLTDTNGDSLTFPITVTTTTVSGS